MKTKLLIFGLFITGFVFPVMAQESNFVGGGSVDLDSELSPTYALDFMGGLFYHTILPLTALFLGISALFLVPYFILKRKNIPSKPYMSLILAGLLLFLGVRMLRYAYGVIAALVGWPFL